ncbi:MAG: GreA/GreB family elongation factor [Caulobacterales bacterium]|nr:GreA/GreB family elongation factor [Caulobacterales bacterium]
MSPDPQTELPDIILSRADFEALHRLVGDLPGRGATALLQQELDRAEVRETRDVPPKVVGLNRWLRYTDGRGEEARRVRLVLPPDADIDQGQVSILSWVGAGLLGLAEGVSVDWPDASGELRRLTPVLVEAD